MYRAGGTMRGVPDVIGFHKGTGKFIGVEVKVGKDKLSLHQEVFLKNLQEANAIAMVARDFMSFKDEIDDILATWSCQNAFPTEPQII